MSPNSSLNCVYWPLGGRIQHHMCLRNDLSFEGKSKHDKLFICLSYNVVTRDVDRDVSTAYCQSSSSDGVDSLPFVSW